MRLKDKVAVVTGAASGIGKEIAKTFAKEGAKVVIADLEFDKAEAVVRELKSQCGAGLAISMDVSNEEQVENGIAAVIKAYGGIDILVSNAGIQHIDPIENLKFSDWKRLLAIQLDGAFLTTRACLKDMYSRGKGGSIIYIGSIFSKDASALKAPYVTAKHGLIGLCKVVAKEGAKHKVRANIICPAFVRTSLVEKQIPQQAKILGISEEKVIRDVMLKDTVDGEFSTMSDIAQVALFFADFETNALTGQSLVVSHGWFMQ